MRRRIGLIGLLSALALGCPGDDGSQDPSTSDDGGSTTEAPPGTTGIGSADTGVVDEDTGTSTGSESTGTTGTTDLPEPLPPLASAPTTVEERIIPTHAIDPAPLLDPRILAERMQLLEEGYGEHVLGPGEDVMALTPDGSDPPAPGPAPSLLSRLVHFADAQLADDESPLRVVDVDSPFITAGFRPQESHACQVTNAAVRTINALHGRMPVDVVVLGGDNADSAQHNEVQWFLDILDGAPVVHCDSGQDDDPEPGEGNDPKDRFAPVGLDVPWLWVSGNHDALVQGNFPVAQRAEWAIGSEIFPGSSTRDWSQPGGPSFEGPVVADEARALLEPDDLLALVVGSGDGHGIDEEAIASGRATYAWDMGTMLRMIVVDSTAPTGGAEGLVTDSDVEGLIRPLLDQAEADGKLVIVATHHASSSLSDGGGIGGGPIPGAITPADWQGLLGDYPNVIAHLCGHWHHHVASFIQPIGARGYWEIVTAALADWPHQMRILEVRDQDNGWITLTGIALDYSAEGDLLATDGRELGILDFTSGWVGDGSGTSADRNVQLWLPAP